MSTAHTSLAAVLLCWLIIGSPRTSAQELEPRAYNNLPVGTNFLVSGYVFSEGAVATDPALPFEDARLEVHSAVLGYVRSFGLLDRSAKIDVVLPYSWLSGSAIVSSEPRERQVSGLNDARLRLTWNPFGAPALTKEEFAHFEQDMVIGASVQITAPIGQYDATRLVNLGTNRWSVKTEIGISKVAGAFTLELAPSVVVYGQNDDFMDSLDREQEPLYAAQGHVIYHLPARWWVALGATYYTGGRTRVNGVENDDRLSTWRLGATLSIPLSRQHSIKLYGSTATDTRIGDEFDSLGIAWQYRWGP